MKRLGLAFGLILAAARAAAAVTAAPLPAGPAAALSPADQAFFEAKIRPVLVDRCYKCHSHDADKVKGGLMLDTREGMLQGGDTGPAIVPGKPDDSLLIDAIGYKDDNLQMPPKNDRLSDQEVADLTEWVRRGAPDPRNGVALGSSLVYGGVGKQHWSFLPVQHPAVPAVKDTAWCRTPVDNFVLAKLEAAGLKPNSDADKRTLIRRVTFDLIGLPPSEAEVQAFLADDSPDAYARVVDRLLASPQYGERWARYWLDLARYADTAGDPPRQTDPRTPDAWTYRDYVIDAFNSDKPYDQFILEQLAADRLLKQKIAAVKESGGDPNTLDTSSLAALGFLTLGNKFEGRMNDVIDDQIDVTTKAFLGLTVTCARCHDHKFDPIPQQDYYSLYGVFADSFEPPKISELPLVHPVDQTPALTDYLAKLDNLEGHESNVQQSIKDLKRMRGADQTAIRDRRRDLSREEGRITTEIADLEGSDPAVPPRADVLLDVPHPRDYSVLIHGEPQNRGPVAPRRFLAILSGPDRPVWKRDSGRLELAEDIASPSNPLTARVLVNRIWQQHFGVGFVPTPDDLGNQSAPPTNPELLDYLAGRFMAEGWSIKKLQRLIVMSSVYRESSAGNPAYAEADPDNTLLWRYNLRRLDFEEIHDALLDIAGTLDLSVVGGRSVPVNSADYIRRRAVYTYIDRNNPPEIMTQFDFPNPNVPSGRRYQTTVPQQSLFLMNSPLVIETARKLTHREDFIDLSSDEERVASLYLAVFQRLPTAAETKLCLHYVESTPGGIAAPASTPESRQAQIQLQQQQRQEARMEAAMEKNPKGARKRDNYQAELGGAAFHSRAPLDAWTKLAHALFQSNEAIFVN